MWHYLLPEYCCLHYYLTTYCFPSPHPFIVTRHTRFPEIAIVQTQTHHRIGVAWVWVKFCRFEEAVSNNRAYFGKHIGPQLIPGEWNTVHEHAMFSIHCHKYLFSIFNDKTCSRDSFFWFWNTIQIIVRTWILFLFFFFIIVFISRYRVIVTFRYVWWCLQALFY